MSRVWDEPVRVQIGSSTAFNVTTNYRTAELLLGKWPVPASEQLTRAKASILRARERPDDPGTQLAARRAFEAAANEAGGLMPPPPKALAGRKSA